MFTTHWKRKRIHFLQLQGKSDTCTMTRNLTNAVEVDYVYFGLQHIYIDQPVSQSEHLQGHSREHATVSITFYSEGKTTLFGPQRALGKLSFAVVSPLKRVRQRVILKAVSAQS